MEYEKLVKEIREEFQIPPFFADESIKNYIDEGLAELTNLVPLINIEKDMLAKSLLKNYCNYAYFKQLDEFWIRYNSSIIRWQFSQLEGVSSDDTDIS